ncbi:phage major capsid protein [Pseudorhodoferax soli]|uniref:HK97 family phage major capsid protein n=1 Tax=Pseudorhodoferax soli TaxID=545864 RepID=A0A368XGN3_9BURK|nr:phage major capsid protein [Pseudorhodoferax soli]RCW65174.1 HK97 family phage major capsid protein [Pseudorhodoferax soli]
MSLVPPGRLAGRYLKSLAATRDRLSAAAFVDSLPWEEREVLKAAVGGVTTATAPELVSSIGQDYMALVRPRTLIGRLQHIRRVPFRTRSIVQIAGATGFWVAETRNVPVQMSTFSQLQSLPMRKVAAVSVVSEELARSSDGEAIVLRDLAAASVAMMDSSFVDPTSAAVSDERPAAITNGQPTVAASGTDAAAVRADIKALIAIYTGDLGTGVFMMTPRVALRIALLLPNDVNVRIDIEAGTGLLFGMPVLLSSAVPGTVIALVDGAAVQLAGADSAELRVSREATILMSNTPDTGAPARVSVFQTDSVALMGLVSVNWQLLRAGAAASLTGVAY